MSLINAFGGAGYTGRGAPSAVSGVQTTDEVFELQKPFIEDLFTTVQAETFDIADDGTKTLRPYEEFTGPRIAAFAPETEEALTGLASLGREGLAASPLAASPQYFQAAKDAATLGQAAFTAADAQRLMNPFLDEVLEQQKREAQRRFESVERPKLEAEAVAAGSFGGSRAALLQAEANRNLQRRLDDIESKGRLTAFEQAQKAFQDERNRQLQGAQIFSALGTEAPTQAARELGLLSSAGEVRQTQEQRALDLAEAEFIRQRDFPMKQLQEMQSVIRGYPFSPSTYEVTTKTSPQPTFGQQLLGGLGSAASLFGAFGGFQPGRKVGGQVVPRQSGGQVRGGLAGLERHQNNLISQAELERRAKQKATPLSHMIMPFLRNEGSLLSQAQKGMRPSPTIPDDRNLAKIISEAGRTVVPSVAAPLREGIPPVADAVGSIVPSRETISDTVGDLIETITPSGERLEAFQEQKRKAIADGRIKTKTFPREGEKLARRLADTRYNILGKEVKAMEGTEGDFGSFEEAEEAVGIIKEREAARKAAIPKGEEELNVEARKEEIITESDDTVASKTESGTTVEPNMGIPDLELMYENTDTIITERLEPQYQEKRDKLRKLLDDYQQTLRDKEKSIGTKRAEADQRKTRDMYLEAAKTFARFGSMGGPEGMVAKFLKAGEPSIGELQKIMNRWDDDQKDLEKIKQDVKKGLYNSEVGYQRYADQVRKTNAEIKLLEAKALAENMNEGMDIDQAAKYLELSFPKSMNEQVKASAVRKFLQLKTAGLTNRAAALQTVAGVESILASGGRAGTGGPSADARIQQAKANLPENVSNVSEKLGK